MPEEDYTHDQTCRGFLTNHFDPELVSHDKISHGISEQLLEEQTELGWRQLSPVDSIIYFQDILPEDQNKVAYMLELVWVEKPGLYLLSAGSDDGMAVWANGDSLGASHRGRSIAPDNDWYRLELKRGYNSLLFKVDQGFGDWGLTYSLRSGADLEPSLRRHLADIYRDLPEAYILPDSSLSLDLKTSPRTKIDSLHRFAWRFETEPEVSSQWQSLPPWQLGDTLPLPEGFTSGIFAYQVRDSLGEICYEERSPVYRQSEADRVLAELRTADRSRNESSSEFDRQSLLMLFGAENTDESRAPLKAFSTRMKADWLWQRSHSQPQLRQTAPIRLVTDPESGKKIPYRLFLPVTMDETEALPVVFQFHVEFDEPENNFWQTYGGGSHALYSKWRAMADFYHMALVLPYATGDKEGGAQLMRLLPAIRSDLNRTISAPLAQNYAISWSKSGLTLLETLEKEALPFAKVALISPWLLELPLERSAIAKTLYRVSPERSIFLRHGLNDQTVPIYIVRRWVNAFRKAGLTVDYREVPHSTHWNYWGDPEQEFYRSIGEK